MLQQIQYTVVNQIFVFRKSANCQFGRAVGIRAADSDTTLVQHVIVKPYIARPAWPSGSALCAECRAPTGTQERGYLAPAPGALPGTFPGLRSVLDRGVGETLVAVGFAAAAAALLLGGRGVGVGEGESLTPGVAAA